MLSPAFTEVSIAVRTLLGLVYVTAAVGKMRHWPVLHGVIANYRLLPDFLVAPVSYGLPPVEALIGATLLLGLLSPWAELAAAALLSLFAVAMGINLVRGRRNIDCGCFQSALKQPLSWTLVIRNAVLILLTLAVVASRGPAADLQTMIDGLLVGSVLFIILQSLNILWSIVPAWKRPGRSGSSAVL